MTGSYLVRAVPGSVQPIPDSNAFAYPDARDITQVDGDVWMMYSDKVDEEGEPDFAAKAGDVLLGGWDRYDDNRQIMPSHPDLHNDVLPIGNALNEAASTFDGTPAFALYANGMGAPRRFWGAENEAPDDNQDRYIVATRFVTDFGGQDYFRVRFTLQAPFDKDNTPDALAIFVYTDIERQNYFYTPGAFLFDEATEQWFTETPIGQSPTGGPAPVYYAVALGALPLNGGGTVPAESGHESHNWDQNLSPSVTALGIGVTDLFNHESIRMGWLGYTMTVIGTTVTIDNASYPPGQIFEISLLDAVNGNVSVPKPPWMSASEYADVIIAIKKAAGILVINATAWSPAGNEDDKPDCP